MEYERIHKVQMGVMSPTKLRMKLLGSHGSSKMDEAKKSPRASPARLDADDDDDDHLKNSLLAQELDEDYPKDRSDSSRSRSDASHGRACHGGGNGYDSGHDAGGSGGGFEFYREERPPAAVVGGPFFRQVPSKWNDAEKWLAGRHVVHSNPIFSKKAAATAAAAVSGHTGGNGCRVAPEASSDVKKSGSELTELSSSSPSSSSSVSKQPHHKRPRISALAPVSMRDVGTEMTPMASKEQSRSGTPAGAATPSLSPLCSLPSSPTGCGSASAAASSSSSSERELQLRTRREIAALGLQLGKMSIASWASKEEELGLPRASPEKRPRPHPGGAEDDGDAKRREFEARAVAWQESQKCKLALRYQRKEVKIQEWESCQKAKFEAKMRHAEVQAEQMKARAKQKLSRRLSALSHKAEGKQARVEMRRSRQAAQLARQVDRIRETGAAPSRLRRCCSWLFL
ncbi:hypothetical protein E2562_023703 [Oryza meyeriana var. granulata]|uniref:Remorin C-terminal domain-containing protein n=1 Tax=Oryza meyeriana var. granulata TaxID=110450 RepID=A0A6G1BNH2_9ORYZ|nr:hypothetical protein E2562_023703 [Oryza meyeriana var. granulata]